MHVYYLYCLIMLKKMCTLQKHVVFFRHLDRISVVLYYLQLHQILSRNFKPLETHSRSSQFEFVLAHPEVCVCFISLSAQNSSPSLGLAVAATSKKFTYSPLHIQATISSYSSIYKFRNRNRLIEQQSRLCTYKAT